MEEIYIFIYKPKRPERSTGLKAVQKHEILITQIRAINFISKIRPQIVIIHKIRNVSRDLMARFACMPSGMVPTVPTISPMPALPQLPSHTVTHIARPSPLEQFQTKFNAM